MEPDRFVTDWEGYLTRTGSAREDRRIDMSTISLRLPEALHRHLREFAQKEGISIS